MPWGKNSDGEWVKIDYDPCKAEKLGVIQETAQSAGQGYLAGRRLAQASPVTLPKYVVEGVGIVAGVAEASKAYSKAKNVENERVETCVQEQISLYAKEAARNPRFLSNCFRESDKHEYQDIYSLRDSIRASHMKKMSEAPQVKSYFLQEVEDRLIESDKKMEEFKKQSEHSKKVLDEKMLELKNKWSSLSITDFNSTSSPIMNFRAEPDMNWKPMNISSVKLGAPEAFKNNLGFGSFSPKPTGNKMWDSTPSNMGAFGTRPTGNKLWDSTPSKYKF